MAKTTGTKRDCPRCKGTGSVDCLRVDQGRCWSCGGKGTQTWVSAETRRERFDTSRLAKMADIQKAAEEAKQRASELATKPHRKLALAQTLAEVQQLRDQWLVLANRQCPVHNATVTRGGWER